MEGAWRECSYRDDKACKQQGNGAVVEVYQAEQRGKGTISETLGVCHLREGTDRAKG